jgi:hypothetical protein
MTLSTLVRIINTNIEDPKMTIIGKNTEAEAGINKVK